MRPSKRQRRPRPNPNRAVRREADVRRREVNSILKEGKRQRREHVLACLEQPRLTGFKENTQKRRREMKQRISTRRARKARTFRQLLARRRRWENYVFNRERRGKAVTRKHRYPPIENTA